MVCGFVAVHADGSKPGGILDGVQLVQVQTMRCGHHAFLTPISGERLSSVLVVIFRSRSTEARRNLSTIIRCRFFVVSDVLLVIRIVP